jgi:hypothetical protein
MIAPDLWSDCSFAEAWYKAGLPFTVHHHRMDLHQASFRELPVELYDDKDFMLQVVEHNARLFKFVSQELPQQQEF